MASIAFTVDGRSLVATDVAGRELVGEHFRVQVRAVGDDDKPADLVGKDFELSVKARRGEELKLTGIVVGASSTYTAGEQVLTIDLGPEAELLDHGQGSRVYLAMTAVVIGKDVLARAGVAAATWTLAGTAPSRPYTAQYLESDWAFLARLLGEEGIYAFYAHGSEGTKLTFANDSTKAEHVAGAFHHRMHHGTVAAEKWVASLALRASATSNAFATRDRDPLKPKLALAGKATAGDAKLEVYAWPARLASDGDVSARAKTSLEALRARRVVMTGESDSPSICCGKIFEIDEGSFAAALRKLFCIGVEWRATAEDPFHLTFTAVPADVPFRPAHRPAARTALGAETAYVRGASNQEIDTDEHARVIVQPTWDRDGKKDDSCSIRSRVGQASLARSMAIPRIGWGMLVSHLDGDVDRPWVMARLVDGTHPPAHTLPANMTRTSWQTLTSASDGTLSQVVFEDKKGAEQILVHAARDMVVEVGDNEARVVGNRHVLEVGADRTVTTDADEKLTVTKDQKTTVKGDETTTIDGSRSITVKGKEADSVDGNRTEEAKKDRTTDVGEKRTLTVSGAMSVKSKKGLTREILKKLTASSGAAWSTSADGGIVVTTKGDSKESVTGARTQNGKTGMQLLVKGDLKDTISAAHVVTVKGSASESAKGTMKLTVGAAFNGTAPSIEIVAESEISIVCGGSTITIKGSEVSIKTAALAITGPLVSSDGATVKHNP
jgi:type VI secretion system secreted protein VgrG